MTRTKIHNLFKQDIGKWVYYHGSAGEVERGKIKHFNNETKFAWVVYKCNNNWDGDHWKDYTAQMTSYADLSFSEKIK